jgi:hypothetical protein
MRKNKTVFTLFLLTLPAVVVLVVGLILVFWRIPTRLQVELTVDRALFTVGGTEATPILNSVGFQFLTAAQFAGIEFSPEQLEVADPTRYIPTEGRYPESAWTSLTVTPPVRLTGEDETLQPAVHFEGTTTAPHIVGILDRVWARPGTEVTVEAKVDQATALSLKIDRQKSRGIVSFREPFQLTAGYSRVSGIGELPYRANALTYRAQLPNHRTHVEITGQADSLVLMLTMPPGHTIDPFFRGGIPVTSVDFTRQNPRGESEPTLVKDGKISYPGYPDVKEVSFKATDFIGLARLEKFRIEAMAFDPEYQGIRLRLHGIAGHVKTGSRDFSKDHRLTRLNMLWQDRRWEVLLTITVSVFSATLGGYRLYKEIRG